VKRSLHKRILINIYTQAHWLHQVSHWQWTFQTCGSITTD